MTYFHRLITPINLINRNLTFNMFRIMGQYRHVTNTPLYNQYHSHSILSHVNTHMGFISVCQCRSVSNVSQWKRHVTTHEIADDLYSDSESYQETTNEKHAKNIFASNNKFMKEYEKQFTKFLQTYRDNVYTYPNIRRGLQLYMNSNAISKCTRTMFKHQLVFACSKNYFTNHENGILITKLGPWEKQFIYDSIDTEIKTLNAAIELLKTLEFSNTRETIRKNLLCALLIIPTFNYLVPGVWDPVGQYVNWFCMISGAIIFNEVFYGIVDLEYRNYSDGNIILFNSAKQTLTLALVDKLNRLNRLNENIKLNC